MANYDLIGNIALMKFPDSVKKKEKLKEAKAVLKQHKTVNTVLEKEGKFSGRLRKIKTKYLVGDKTKEALYKENNCIFRLNVDDCYFSSRLGADRLEVAGKIKQGNRVLVMFSGIGIYGIVIAKNSKAKEVVCVEISRQCSKYALENVKRNKLEGRVKIVQGDVRKKIGKSKEVQGKWDKIIMARPNLKDDFLDNAFSVSAKGTEIYYHGFYHEEDVEFKEGKKVKDGGKLGELIRERAKESGKKVKILGIKRAGDIAPFKWRYRIDFKVLN